MLRLSTQIWTFLHPATSQAMSKYAKDSHTCVQGEAKQILDKRFPVATNLNIVLHIECARNPTSELEPNAKNWSRGMASGISISKIHI